MPNCNDEYEKIVKKIEEEQRKYRYCYIQGPRGERGETGERGIQGEKGDKGEQGDIGLTGLQGPRGLPGPTTIAIGKVETVSADEGANIINVGTAEDLILDFKIPQGIQGEKGDTGPRGLPGEIGSTEHISIDETETVEPEESAQVLDTFENMVHHLTFYVPRGEKGEKGDVGPTGPTGIVEKNPAGYESVLFVSYAQANYSKIMTIQDQLEINNNQHFDFIDNTNVAVNQPGIYEITLCGQISGVDQSHGAIFYLSNTEGAVIQDLSFEVKAGTTSRMDCSETIITKFEKAVVLYVRCGILGDSNTANIDFANVNLIIKKYNVAI